MIANASRNAQLMELDALQDELLTRLEELDHRIEAVLAEFAPAMRTITVQSNNAAPSSSRPAAA